MAFSESKKAIYVKISTSAALLDNCCPVGPYNYNSNGEKSAQLELPFSFCRVFCPKMTKNLCKN